MQQETDHGNFLTFTKICTDCIPHLLHTVVLVITLASTSSGAMNMLPSLLIVGLALPSIAYISQCV